MDDPGSIDFTIPGASLAFLRHHQPEVVAALPHSLRTRINAGLTETERADLLREHRDVIAALQHEPTARTPRPANDEQQAAAEIDRIEQEILEEYGLTNNDVDESKP